MSEEYSAKVIIIVPIGNYRPRSWLAHLGSLGFTRAHLSAYDFLAIGGFTP